MHDKVYNRRVAPATLLLPPALEVDTQDGRVTFIRSIAKLKLLKFDARSLCFERASYFAKLNLLSTEFLLTFCQTVVKSCSCQFLVRWLMGKDLVPNDLLVRR